jgi:hypothetical protein
MAQKLDENEMVSFKELLMANSIQVDALAQLLIEEGIISQPNKHNLNTVDAVIDDIIAEMPLDDRVRTANLDEDGLLVLQIGLGKYLRYLLENQSEDVNKKLLKECIKLSGKETLDEDEAPLYILKELWIRLKETHRLKVVK